MKVLDPGHQYELDNLDSKIPHGQVLTFVKREGPGYPGNVGHWSGTNIQEVLRALIDRVKYLDNQIPDFRNSTVLGGLRLALENLEYRAAERHERHLNLGWKIPVEQEPYCGKCGHIGCPGACHA